METKPKSLSKSPKKDSPSSLSIVEGLARLDLWFKLLLITDPCYIIRAPHHGTRPVTKDDGKHAIMEKTWRYSE